MRLPSTRTRRQLQGHARSQLLWYEAAAAPAGLWTAAAAVAAATAAELATAAVLQPTAPIAQPPRSCSVSSALSRCRRGACCATRCRTAAHRCTWHVAVGVAAWLRCCAAPCYRYCCGAVAVDRLWGVERADVACASGILRLVTNAAKKQPKAKTGARSSAVTGCQCV